MKNEFLYEEYMAYLDWRLSENQINKGKWSLLKMSRSSFEDFKNKIENDEYFNNKIANLYKTEIRDQKIDDILENKIEMDDIFSDLDDITIDKKKIDDIFDDFNF